MANSKPGNDQSVPASRWRAVYLAVVIWTALTIFALSRFSDYFSS